MLLSLSIAHRRPNGVNVRRGRIRSATSELPSSTMRSLTEALAWRSRLLVSPTIWSLAARTRDAAADGWNPPDAQQESDDGKFSRWVVDGRRYWLPLGQRFAGLEA